MQVFELLNLFGGIETGIGCRDFGAHFSEVSGEFGRERLDQFGLFGSEVVLFAGVIDHVVELLATVFVVTDQLVVSLADDSGWFTSLIPVVRIVPEKSAVRPGAFESGNE